ncbi:MAG: hypothetical protein ACRC46_15655 [Thermoguttaceae bacterium]
MPFPSSITQEEFCTDLKSPHTFDPVAEIRRLRRELTELAGAFDSLVPPRDSVATHCAGEERDTWCEGDVVRYASHSALVPAIATSRGRLAELVEFSPRLDLPPLETVQIRKPLGLGERQSSVASSETLPSARDVVMTGAPSARCDSVLPVRCDSAHEIGWGRHGVQRLRELQSSSRVTAPLQPRYSLHRPVVSTSHEVSRSSDLAAFLTLLGVAAVVVGTTLYFRSYQVGGSNLEALGLQVGFVGAIVLAIRLVGEAFTPKAS